LFKPGDYFEFSSIGRVVVAEKHRNKNFGHKLITQSILEIKKQHLMVKDQNVKIVKIYIKKHMDKKIKKLFLKNKKYTDKKIN
jgi:ElaA protein